MQNHWFLTKIPILLPIDLMQNWWFWKVDFLKIKSKNISHLLMNLKKKTEIDFLARHQIMMGHKVVQKKNVFLRPSQQSGRISNANWQTTWKNRPKSEQKCKSDRRPMDLPPSLVDRVSDPPAREHACRMSQLYAVTQWAAVARPRTQFPTFDPIFSSTFSGNFQNSNAFPMNWKTLS